jgi:hypothetical protein
MRVQIKDSIRDFTLIIILLLNFGILRSQIVNNSIVASQDAKIVASQSASGVLTGDGNNYGTESSLRSRKLTETSGGTTIRTVERGLIQFDLESVPLGSNVESATLVLRKTSNTYSTVNLYLSRITIPWNEDTITWSDIATSTSSSDRITWTADTGNYITINVKDHLSKFVDSDMNYGWMILISSESTDTPVDKGWEIYTKENGSYQPRLVFSYYEPIETSVEIVASATTTSANGSSNIIAIKGNGTGYSYKWFNSSGTLISSTSSITSVNPGLYYFEVTDAKGGISRRFVIIPCEDSDLTIALRPQDTWSEDALINMYDKNKNYEISPHFGTGFGNYPDVSYCGIWALLNFDLCGLPEDHFILEADLNIKCTRADNTNSDNNASLSKIVSYWKEGFVTWNKKPITAIDNIVSIPKTTSLTTYTFDVSPFYTEIIDGRYNWGIQLKLDVILSGGSRSSVYYRGSESLPSGQLSEAPTLQIKVSKKIPQYCVLSKELDGGYYKLANKKLLCVFDEEYEDTDGDLDYTIYDMSRQTVINGNTAQLDSHEGDNRLVFDISNGTLFTSGEFYILEVKNQKGEIWKLRFKR